MLHLRIVAPTDRAHEALDLLSATASVANIIHLHGVAQRPAGDMILCDVAREDASVVLSDLKQLGLHKSGSISMEEADTTLSEAADRAEKAARGYPSDAVVWEEVEARTSETAELSGSFLAFMVLACLIAAVGIYLDTPILIIGAMVVGPEFGPLAGVSVALVQRRRELAVRSAVALLIGFPLGIAAAWLATVIFKSTGVIPDTFDLSGHSLSEIISSPDFLSFFVAFCAGIAGILSLTTSKSGALIGVLISVTTIPAAANIGVGIAYQDADSWQGSLQQLGINLGALMLAGVVTLTLQRLLFARREARHKRRLAALRPGTTTPPASSGPGGSPRR